MLRISLPLFILMLCLSFLSLAQTTNSEVVESTISKKKKKKGEITTSNTDSLKFKEEGIIDGYNCLNIQAAKYIPANSDFSGLVIVQDEDIEVLSLQYMDEKKIMGYKIQIFSGNSRWDASKIKTDFIKDYPDFPVPTLIYQTPNFKLRVGNYKNRFEAEKDLKELKENISAAFIIKDEINIIVEEEND